MNRSNFSQPVNRFSSFILSTFGNIEEEKGGGETKTTKSQIKIGNRVKDAKNQRSASTRQVLKHSLIFRTHGDAGNGAAPLIDANRITVEKNRGERDQI